MSIVANAQRTSLLLLGEGMSSSSGDGVMVKSRNGKISEITYETFINVSSNVDYYTWVTPIKEHVAIIQASNTHTVHTISTLNVDGNIVYNASFPGTTPANASPVAWIVNQTTGTIFVSLDTLSSDNIYRLQYGSSTIEQLSNATAVRWSFATDGSRIIAVPYSVSGTTSGMYSDDDGVTWNSFALPSAQYGVPSYGNGIWVIPSTIVSNCRISYDGINFTSTTYTIGSPNPAAVTIYNAELGYFESGGAGGLSSDIRISRDGQNWTTPPAGMLYSTWDAAPLPMWKGSGLGIFSKRYVIDKRDLFSMPTSFTLPTGAYSVLTNVNNITFFNTGECLITEGAWSYPKIMKNIIYKYAVVTE